MSLQQAKNGTNADGEDSEISIMLNEIKEVVRRMTTNKGMKMQINEGLDVDKVREDLTGYLPQSSTSSSSDPRDKLKDFLNRTLECVQTVGGIVAEGASYVPGVGSPATAGYNALTFVIQAYQNYKRSFETLEKLLEMCLDSLDRFAEYRGKYMGPSLRRVACKQLQFFVNTCEYALNLRRSRRFRINAFLKITLFNDDHVQTLLEGKKQLNEKELSSAMVTLVAEIDEIGKNVNNVRIAVKEVGKDVNDVRIAVKEVGKDVIDVGTAVDKVGKDVNNVETAVEKVGKDVNDVANSVDKLNSNFTASLDKQNEDRAEQKSDKAEREQKSILFRVLRWQTPDGKAPDAVWETTLTSYLNSSLNGTGSWLEKDSRFSAWANGTTLDMPILGIAGGDGTGKTRLTATIIKYLRQLRKSSDPTARSYVSYHFMKKDSKEEEGDIAVTVSRSMLWQLAEDYQPFLKSAASICKNRKTIDRSYDLWKHLLFNNEELSNSDCIFFFIFDGFSERTHIDFLNKLLEELKQGTIARHRLRLLITGKKADLEQLGNAGAIDMQIIELGLVNLSDVKLFIDHHMKRVNPKPWSNRPGMEGEVVDQLKTLSGGNYREMKGTLDQVSKMEDEEEIEKWLKQADTKTLDPIATIIEDLSKRCSHNDIQNINEVILWVIGCRYWLSPLQMEGAVSLRYPMPGRQMLETRYLQSKLKNKWHLLFDMNGSDNDATVSFNNTSIDIATRVIPPKLRSVDDEGHIEGSQDIQPAEVTLVKHYLKTVCPPETYDRFGFAKFFEQKLLPRKNRIYQDPDNAELILSSRCLTCLVEKRNSVTQAFHGYAAEYLHLHLRAAVCEEGDDVRQDGRLSLTDTDLRAEVGALLVKLFSEDYAINSLFRIHGRFGNDEGPSALARKALPSNWQFWLTADSGVDLLTRYFDDQVVLKPVEETPLAKAFVSRQKNRHEALLQPAARTAVKYFVAKDATNREVETAFLFLLAAEARSHCQMTSDKDLETYLWKPTAKRVEGVEAWSKEMAPPDMDNSVWEAHMASIFHHFYVDGNEHITTEHVQTRARKAQASSYLAWQVSYTLAQVTKLNSDAANILEEMIKGLTKDKSWCDVPSNRPVLAKIYLDLGDRYWSFDGSPKRDDAVKMFKMSIEQDTSHHDRYLEIISRCAKQGLWSHIESFIEALSKRSDSGDGTPIGKLVVKGVLKDNETFSTSLKQMAEQRKRWDLLETAYDQGLKEKLSYLPAFQIRCAYGEALQNAPNHEDAQLKVWEDILKAKTPQNSEYLGRSALTFLVTKLMPIYTKRAALEESTGVDAFTPTYAKRIDIMYEEFQLIPAFSTQKVLYFTRYFVLCKNHERAKASVKEFLAQSLDMMSNDDRSDDALCFWQLQSIFSTFGDVDNATAAMYMMVVAKKAEYKSRMDIWKSRNGAEDGPQATKDEQPLTESEGLAQELQEPEESAQEPTQEPTQEPVLMCDGCGKHYYSPSGLWTCADECGLVQLDEKCHKRLHIDKNALEKHACNQDHKVFQIPECTVEEMKDGMVRVGKCDVTLSDWKQKIIEDYSLVV